MLSNKKTTTFLNNDHQEEKKMITDIEMQIFTYLELE
jgi:hypothetical protein